MKKTEILSLNKFFYVVSIFVLLFALTMVFDINSSEDNSSIAASGNWSSYTDTSWLGSGTIEDPFLITSANELAGLAARVNNGNKYKGIYFEQTKDINLSAHYWIPIGGGQSGTIRWFEGNYYGCGYDISGLYINQSRYVCVGLFGIVKGGSIRGVNVTSGTINGDGDTAAIVGYTEGGTTWIQYCSNSAMVNGTWRVGGIVGGYQNRYSTGLIISNCYNRGQINGNVIVGGILGGQNNNGMYCTISNCYNTGRIYGDGAGNDNKSLVGGIVGRLAGVEGATGSSANASGYARDTWNTGKVSKNTYVGGIAGEFFYPNENMMNAKGSNYFSVIGSQWGDGHNEGRVYTKYLPNLTNLRGQTSWYTSSTNWYSPWDMTYTWQISSGFPVFQVDTLTLNANGGSIPSTAYFTGSGSTASRQKSFSARIGKLPTPTRTGYTFKGWFTVASGGTQVTSSTGFGSLSRTIYAQWTANTYTVSYKLNSGSYGSYHPTSWTYNTPQRISNPTRTGYTFDGWTASGLSTSTAVYGTGSNPTTKWSSASTKVKASSATGALYFKNLRTTSGTITLTANWTINQYDLNFDANGGSVSVQQRPLNYGAQYGTLPTPTRTGYTFNGWFTAASGGNQVSATTTMGASDTTIYAHWTVNTYTVKFDEQGGTANLVDLANTRNGTVSVNGNIYTLTVNGLTYTYNTATQILTVNGTQSDEARFSYVLINDFVANDKYRVEVEYIGGTPSTSDGCQVLEVFNSSNTTLSPRNHLDYQFPTAGTQNVELTISETGETEGYALVSRMWRDKNDRVFNNYQIKFRIVQTAGETKHKIKELVYGNVLTPIAIPTKTGYIFQGYFAGKNGTGTQYYNSDGTPCNNKTMDIANNTTTLYAYWTAKTDCVLSFNANGGTVSPASRNQTFNASLGTLPVPTRTGYIFTGWYTSASRGSEVTSSTIMKSESMTIYAHWAETWANAKNVEEPTKTSIVDDKNYTLIENEKQLAWLINNAGDDYFLITNHLDMSAYYWEPLGTTSRPFSALIDGQGYTIKGLHTISQSLRRDGGGDNSGFIGVASGATIKNIFFENISISGKNYVGAVIGKVKGSNKTNVSGIAVRNDKTTVGERLVEATGTKGIIVGYSEVNQAAKVRDCLGVQGTSCGAYFQVATVDCKDSIGYIWNGSSYSMSKSAASNNFANWITVTGIPFQLPAGFAWIAEGK